MLKLEKLLGNLKNAKALKPHAPAVNNLRNVLGLKFFSKAYPPGIIKAAELSEDLTIIKCIGKIPAFDYAIIFLPYYSKSSWDDYNSSWYTFEEIFFDGKYFDPLTKNLYLRKMHIVFFKDNKVLSSTVFAPSFFAFHNWHRTIAGGHPSVIDDPDGRRRLIHFDYDEEEWSYDLDTSANPTYKQYTKKDIIDLNGDPSTGGISFTPNTKAVLTYTADEADYVGTPCREVRGGSSFFICNNDGTTNRTSGLGIGYTTNKHSLWERRRDGTEVRHSIPFDHPEFSTQSFPSNTGKINIPDTPTAMIPIEFSDPLDENLPDGMMNTFKFLMYDDFLLECPYLSKMDRSPTVERSPDTKWFTYMDGYWYYLMVNTVHCLIQGVFSCAAGTGSFYDSTDSWMYASPSPYNRYAQFEYLNYSGDTCYREILDGELNQIGYVQDELIRPVNPIGYHHVYIMRYDEATEQHVNVGYLPTVQENVKYSDNCASLKTIGYYTMVNDESSTYLGFCVMYEAYNKPLAIDGSWIPSEHRDYYYDPVIVLYFSLPGNPTSITAQTLFISNVNLAGFGTHLFIAGQMHGDAFLGQHAMDYATAAYYCAALDIFVFVGMHFIITCNPDNSNVRFIKNFEEDYGLTNFGEGILRGRFFSCMRSKAAVDYMTEDNYRDAFRTPSWVTYDLFSGEMVSESIVPIWGENWCRFYEKEYDPTLE